VKKPTKW